MQKITTKPLTKAIENQRKALRYYGAASDQYKAAVAAVEIEMAPLREPVNTALAAINGRANAHTITSYKEVFEAAIEAEQQLDRAGLPQKNRVGLIAEYDPTISLPNAYSKRGGNTVISTHITMKRTADGWRLTNVARKERWTKSTGGVVITVDEATAEVIKANAIAPFHVAA